MRTLEEILAASHRRLFRVVRRSRRPYQGNSLSLPSSILCSKSHCLIWSRATSDFWHEARDGVFDALGIILSLSAIVLVIEIYARVIADDGMQFDLEMWKYARDVKQLSANPLLAHEHAPNRVRLY